MNYDGRNHLCQFWCWKIKELQAYGGSKFGISHWNGWSPLLQCCDTAQSVKTTLRGLTASIDRWACRPVSRVISWGPVTIFFLPLFDGGFEYLDQFRKKWAPMSLSNVSTLAARGAFQDGRQKTAWKPYRAVSPEPDGLGTQMRCRFLLYFAW